MESYKHLFAKQTLARWLADPEQKLIDCPDAEVFLEYPFCLDSGGRLHGDTLWRESWLNADADGLLLPGKKVPTYQECLDAKLVPICIFDIVIAREGTLDYAFEVVHKHDLTKKKEAHIDRIVQESTFRHVYGVSAEWVLQQVGLPKKLKSLWQIY